MDALKGPVSEKLYWERRETLMALTKVAMSLALMKTAVGLWIVASCLVLGFGLHRIITPDFWGPSPWPARGKAAIQITIGVLMFLALRAYGPKYISRVSDDQRPVASASLNRS